jgi:hypothetical protein
MGGVRRPADEGWLEGGVDALAGSTTVNDCAGFTSSASTLQGYVSLPNPGTTQTFVGRSTCTAMLPLVCCN